MLVESGNRVKLEIYLTEKPVVLHTLIRTCDDRIIELDAPMHNGKKIAVPPKTKVILYEYESTGLLMVDTVVLEVRLKPVVIWLLKVPGLESIRKIQRRADKRYEISYVVKWKKIGMHLEDEQKNLHIIDLSISGAQIEIPVQLAVGDEILVDLTPLVQSHTKMYQHEVAPLCRIVRSVTGRAGRYGVCFINLSKQEQVYLSETLRKIKTWDD